MEEGEWEREDGEGEEGEDRKLDYRKVASFYVFTLYFQV